MRFYLFLLLLAPVLLASCNPDPDPGPRIDLVGSTRFLSASRTSTTPADTFTTRVFAETQKDTETNLNRLRITVQYSPTRNPYVYPVTGGYDYKNIPSDAGALIYLDTVLAGAQQRSVAFQFTANTRTTSGRELWTFEAEDANGKLSRRSFQLTLRNPDSLLTYHRYTLLLPAPTRPGSRSYLALLPGLALPSHAVRQNPENQALIDLAYLPLPNGARALASPNDPLLMRNNPLFRAGNWTNRVTQLRATGLDSTSFSTTDTEAELRAAYSNGTLLPNPTRTNPLTTRGAGRVLAFQTADGKTGLIFIQSLPTAPTAAIRMQVRITK